jgi:hypothetical protein
MGYVRLVMAVLLFPLARLKAQDAPALEPGVRVRVSTAPRTSRANWTVGTVIAVTGDRLAIRTQQHSGSTIDIARSSVTQLEVSRGQHSRALTGLGLGFLIGAGVGAVIGVGGEDLAPTDGKLIGAGLGAVGGALVGLVVGSSSTSERWQKISVTLSGMRGAQGFGSSIRVSVNLHF